MKSVIEKLAQIEQTAESIVEKAEERKREIEKEISEKRVKFDENLEQETQKKLQELRKDGEEKMNLRMEEEREKNAFYIARLKEEYGKNHKEYAEKLLQKILEV